MLLVSIHSIVTQVERKKKKKHNTTSCWVINTAQTPWSGSILKSVEGLNHFILRALSSSLISHKVLIHNLYYPTASYFSYSFFATCRTFQLPIRKCFAQENDSSTNPVHHLLYPTSSFNFHPINLRAKVCLLYFFFLNFKLINLFLYLKQLQFQFHKEDMPFQLSLYFLKALQNTARGKRLSSSAVLF